MSSFEYFYGLREGRVAPVAAVLLLAPAVAFAEASSAPTSVNGVSVVSTPPAGFNPVTASPAARERYAVPAPDASIAPNAYGEWLKAVSGPQTGVATPAVQQTHVFNGPIKGASAAPPQAAANSAANATSNNIVAVTSSNWSGPSFVSSGAPFAVEAIIGEFVVPTAHKPFGQPLRDGIIFAVARH